MEDFLCGGKQYMTVATAVKKFVVGFVFDPSFQTVLMIRKKRPPWMNGLLNGIGGHVEENESYADAISREFGEEAGMTPPLTPFLLLHRRDRDLQCFFAIGDLTKAASMTDERVEIVRVEDLATRNDIVIDTKWVLFMAREAAETSQTNFLMFYEITDQCSESAWDTLQ